METVETGLSAPAGRRPPRGARGEPGWPQLSPGPDKPENKPGCCEGKEAPTDKGGKGTLIPWLRALGHPGGPGWAGLLQTGGPGHWRQEAGSPAARAPCAHRRRGQATGLAQPPACGSALCHLCTAGVSGLCGGPKRHSPAVTEPGRAWFSGCRLPGLSPTPHPPGSPEPHSAACRAGTSGDPGTRRTQLEDSHVLTPTLQVRKLRPGTVSSSLSVPTCTPRPRHARPTSSVFPASLQDCGATSVCWGHDGLPAVTPSPGLSKVLSVSDRHAAGVRPSPFSVPRVSPPRVATARLSHAQPPQQP